MKPEIIIAVLAFLGTVVGSLGGIIAASRLTNYKIDDLKSKVEKHNQIIERTYRLEASSCAFLQRLEKIEDTLDTINNKTE